MEMPSSLQLFGQPWMIVEHEPTPILDNQFRGMTVFPMRQIHILSGSMQQSTLLHELIHVAEEMTGADLAEAQVEAIERGLWNIFSTNPQILDYFRGKHTGTRASSARSGSKIPVRTEEVRTSGASPRWTGLSPTPIRRDLGCGSVFKSFNDRKEET